MARRRRGANEGSIFELPDGRWRAMVDLGYRNGKRWRKAVEATTRDEVQRTLNDLLHDHRRGINIAPERQTVGQFLSRWLEIIKSDIAPSTYVSYEGIVRSHLTPALGRISLSKLRASHVQRFKQEKLAAMIQKGPGVKKPVKGQPPPEMRRLSTRTVYYCLAVLRMALAEACRLDMVPRNIAILVAFPSLQQNEIRPLAPEQAQKFLEAIKGHRLEAFYSIAMALGLREGEGLGLQWPDIDFESGTVAVRRSIRRVKVPGEEKSRLLVREPKRRSRRTISLPQIAVSALCAHRARQAEERQQAGRRWHETGYVFTTTIGTALDPRKVAREFQTILATSGLPRIRLHDLRHTAATLLLAQGVHPRVVMDLLGHSQIGVTMNTYSHVVPELRKEAAAQMDAILNPAATVVATGAEGPKPQ
jgi:integrase